MTFEQEANNMLSLTKQLDNQIRGQLKSSVFNDNNNKNRYDIMKVTPNQQPQQ
jgi:hypothetical protein